MENCLLKEISLEEANSGSLRCLLSREFEGFPQRLFGTFFRKKVRKESFFEHTGAEMTRLLGDDDHEGYFTKNYQRWMEGEAKRSKNRFEKPLFSGGPSTRQLTQMAATIAASASPLGPMGAMAVTAAFSCYDVAQGNMNWKHAAVQTAVSGVAGMAGGIAPGGLAPYAGQLVTMAASGIDYKEGGGIGWSNDNLKAGVKSGVTSMAMNYVLQNTLKGYTHLQTGIQSGVMSSLDFDTNKWYKIGLNDDNDKWDSLAIGVTSGIGSWASSKMQNVFTDKNDFSQTGSLGHYTSKLINNFVSNSLLAGYFSKRHDISYADALTSGDSEGNYGTNIWGNALYTHQDVGGYIGNQIGTGIKNWGMTDEQIKARDKAQADAARRAREQAEKDAENQTLLGGLWQGIKNIGKDIASIGSAIANGAESLVNWISGKGFKTDKEIKVDRYLKILKANKLIGESNIEEGAGKLGGGSYIRERMEKINENLDAIKKDGLSQRDNQCLTPGSSLWNMCNPTSFATALTDLGVTIEDAQEQIKISIENNAEAKARFEQLQATNGGLDLNNINQLEDAIDILRYINNYGSRTSTISLVKTIQHFEQIEEMVALPPINGVVRDWKYKDSDINVRNYNFWQTSGEENSGPLSNNNVSSEQEAKEYYMKMKECLTENDRVIITTKLTNSGHVTSLYKIEDDGIIIRDPYGPRVTNENGEAVYEERNDHQNKYGSQTKYNWQEVYDLRLGVRGRSNVIIRKKRETNTSFWARIFN